MKSSCDSRKKRPVSYNVFADMGFENPEEELLKSGIISSLRTLIEEKPLTMKQVTSLWRMEASAVAELLRGHWGDYPVERLFQFAAALERNVRVTIDSQDTMPGEQARTLVRTG